MHTNTLKLMTVVLFVSAAAVGQTPHFKADYYDDYPPMENYVPEEETADAKLFVLQNTDSMAVVQFLVFDTGNRVLGVFNRDLILLDTVMLTENDVAGFPSTDPMWMKYPSTSPYAYVGNNPIMRIDPTGEGDFYNEFTGKYLGTDGIDNGMNYLINAETYSNIVNQSGLGVLEIDKYTALWQASRILNIDNKIDKMLQDVANSSTDVEHQMYFVLDRENAMITVVRGEAGTNNSSEIQSTLNTNTGVSLVRSSSDGKMKILIGQAHGHPASDKPNHTTERTMSDVDKQTSQELQIPIYGIDAMDNRVLTDPANIHRVTPDGKIDNNIGNTLNSGNAMARESLKIWGTSGYVNE